MFEYEAVTDEQVVNLIQQGINNSVGDWLNSSDLAKEREKSTNEYGMIPQGHLSPQGVSQLVASDTVEVVEGYLAILAELLFNDNRLTRFVPYQKNATSLAAAQTASKLVDHIIFNENPGWAILNTWLKSALLWKNSIVHWEYVASEKYEFQTYEQLDINTLQLMLSEDDSLVVVGYDSAKDIDIPDELTGESNYVTTYTNLRTRRVDRRGKICLHNIRPELFRISRDATCIQDASFVSIQEETTLSDILQNYPDKIEALDESSIFSDESTSSVWQHSEERAARKQLAGEAYNLLTRFASEEDGPNRVLMKTHAWLRVDRDGDGIAERKRFTLLGSHILEEEDEEDIPMASIVPFEIPHEFHGLSAADFARSSTLATTAILRGFVENVYMTNYSPKLADPNSVDFGTLQNLRPKQLIPTTGSPVNAVIPLAPDSLSSGTVPLLELLQVHKEQATGLSKAAQGLNDTLYVSGNSEQKVAMVQNATQVRIQYMARRIVETGIKPMLLGIYKLARKKMAGSQVPYLDMWGDGGLIDPATLPEEMHLSVCADVGDFGDTNMLKRLELVGSKVIPALQEAGAGGLIAPEAAANVATQTLAALHLKPTDYILDSSSNEFKQKAEESRAKEQAKQQEQDELAKEIQRLDIEQRKATMALTNIQTKNAMQDNTRQLMIAMDAHYQKWADLAIKAADKGVPIDKPDVMQLLQLASAFLGANTAEPIKMPAINETGETPLEQAADGLAQAASGPIKQATGNLVKQAGGMLGGGDGSFGSMMPG